MAFRVIKDPSERLDYAWDWSVYLGVGETILSAIPTVPAGLTLDLTPPHINGFTTTATSVTVWLSGGTVGTVYAVSCKITTSGGRIVERDITVTVENR